MNKKLLSLAVALAASWPSATLIGQVAVTAEPPPADSSDVGTVDAIMKATYDVISGDAGVARNWDRFRSLFIPGARLIPTGATPERGYRHVVWTSEEYISRAGASLERDGFFEREIHRVEERFGPVVHVFSTYESRRREDDPAPFTRGINSFQLFWDGTRWWVVTIYWHGETAEAPIPSRYLPQ